MIAPWPTFHDLMIADKSCRLHKPASHSQILFESRLGKNLAELSQEIHSGRYHPMPTQCFVVTEPKPREIFAAHFRDRVVHHLIISQLEPHWEKTFIHSSFACRKGKGPLKAIHYAQDQVRRISQGGRRPVWALQVDVEKYFVTIHRPTLTQLMLTPIRKSMLRNLVQLIFEHDARIGAKRRGDPSHFKLITAGKSWFDQATDRGIAIGNLSSQFGANVYLSALDHWIQRELKPQAYLRYMDDGLLLDTNPKHLESMPGRIDEWLQTFRKQRLNPYKTHLIPLHKGIDYLGYQLRQTNSPSAPLQIDAEPIKKWKLVKSLRQFERIPHAHSARPHPLAPFLPNPVVMRKIATINSRLGIFHHCRSYGFRKHALQRFIHHKTEPHNIPAPFADPFCPLQIKKDYRAIRLK